MMADEFPHPPGINTKRQFQGYNSYQETLWQAFSDTYFSRSYGYAEGRMATPGLQFDQEAFLAWRQKAVNAWHKESGRDLNTRGLTSEDLPEHLWLYLYERFLAAAPLKPPPPKSSTHHD